MRAALETGADAVHPGLRVPGGERRLAEAVEAAGLVWVGPPPDALRSGGDKLDAKRIAREAGVPVVETGDAETLGYPLLIKAAAGGGGRGMRVVRSAGELEASLEAARREAEAAFGDDTVFFERYLESARHIEVQLLARRARARSSRSASASARSSAGTRRCSRSRRRPWSIAALRAELVRRGDPVRRCDRLPGAGTAEFVVTGREFFFLELNARIQVEHPVTEAVTGLDLIAEQIRIAEGARARGRRRRRRGHAIEVRLYAEDPRTLPAADAAASSGSGCRARCASTRASTRATRSGRATTR